MDRILQVDEDDMVDDAFLEDWARNYHAMTGRKLEFVRVPREEHKTCWNASGEQVACGDDLPDEKTGDQIHGD